jgi:hypothetical protein
MMPVLRKPIRRGISESIHHRIGWRDRSPKLNGVLSSCRLPCGHRATHSRNSCGLAELFTL